MSNQVVVVSHKVVATILEETDLVVLVLSHKTALQMMADLSLVLVLQNVSSMEVILDVALKVMRDL